MGEVNAKGIQHIVALSGGKDSTAMALRLKEVEPRNYIYICTPTGDELPDVIEHWNKLEDLLSQPIIRLRDPDNPTIYDLIDHMHMLPNWRARWCTRILKIELAQQFYAFLKPAIVYVGLRADEQKRQGNKLYDENIEQRFPMQEWGWGIDDVWSYLNENGIAIPRRTDCAMCFYQRLDEWWLLWRDYPQYFERIENLEVKIGHTLMSPSKHKKWPHKLAELRKEFESGRLPTKAKRHMDCRVCSL